MIKHKIRDILISLFDALGIIYLYKHSKQKKGPLVRVLCFHDVTNKDWFENIILLCIKKYNVVTPEEFHNHKFKSDKINVLLTFDDGYHSWIDVCLPILKRYDVRGLFFINSGLLDAHNIGKEAVDEFMNRNLRIRTRRALSWNGAIELVQSGHAVGGHTVSHVDLVSSTLETAKTEILLDKKELETKLGVKMFDFAYPFGTEKYFSEEIINFVLAAGYKYHYSAISNFADSGFYSDTSPVPRTLLEDSQSLKTVQRWIEGGYDLFIFLK